MRVQVAHPEQHAAIFDLPFREPLGEWSMPNVHRVLGLHRHVVKLIEFGDVSYVVKELPDSLAEREYRLFREVDEARLPTAEVVAVVTGRDIDDGLIITRHLDYSLPYRSLLMGRGLEIPYLGDRMLDAMVALLVRIHLAGFFWGDCSLSNILFRRDAGTLQAYIIDLETAEMHGTLSNGQRSLDVMVARDNLAGGLLDLQSAGKLKPGIDPIEVALAVEDRYKRLWDELTKSIAAPIGDADAIRARLDRLHELGFAVDELEFVTRPDGRSVNVVPKVVEHGYHRKQLAQLTGLQAGDNQARRMLQDIKSYHAYLREKSPELNIPFNVAAVRWLDQVFEPIMAAIPPEMFDRLQPAEIFHQLLEHRWYRAEESGSSQQLIDLLDDYLDLLRDAPEERRLAETTDAADDLDLTGEIVIPATPRDAMAEYGDDDPDTGMDAGMDADVDGGATGATAVVPDDAAPPATA